MIFYHRKSYIIKTMPLPPTGKRHGFLTSHHISTKLKTAAPGQSVPGSSAPEPAYSGTASCIPGPARVNAIWPWYRETSGLSGCHASNLRIFLSRLRQKLYSSLQGILILLAFWQLPTHGGQHQPLPQRPSAEWLRPASFTYLFNRLIVCIIGKIIIISLLNVIAFIVGAVHLKLKLGQLKVLRKGIANLSEEHLVGTALCALSLI